MDDRLLDYYSRLLDMDQLVAQESNTRYVIVFTCPLAVNSTSTPNSTDMLATQNF